MHLTEKRISMPNPLLINKYSKRKMMSLYFCFTPRACFLCEKSRFARIRTSWCRPEALMPGEKTGVSVTVGPPSPALCVPWAPRQSSRCAAGPTGQEAAHSLMLWGSLGADSLGLSKVHLEPTFPPSWQFHTKIRFLLALLTCTLALLFLHQASPLTPFSGPAPGNSHPAHPAPAVKAHGWWEGGDSPRRPHRPRAWLVATDQHGGLFYDPGLAFTPAGRFLPCNHGP